MMSGKVVNPLTNRKIKVGGALHKKLCKDERVNVAGCSEKTIKIRIKKKPKKEKTIKIKFKKSKETRAKAAALSSSSAKALDIFRREATMDIEDILKAQERLAEVKQLEQERKEFFRKRKEDIAHERAHKRLVSAKKAELKKKPALFRADSTKPKQLITNLTMV